MDGREKRREKRRDRRQKRTGTSNEKFAHLFAFDVSERRTRPEGVEGSYIISLNLEGCSLICSGVESRRDDGVLRLMTDARALDHLSRVSRKYHQNGQKLPVRTAARRDRDG